MARRGQAACDGRGASRVCRVLRCLDRAPGCEEFLVRPALPDDMEQVFRLANDRTVRDNSFSPEPISLADHAAWFGERISSPATAFYVMEFEGVVAAVARFDAVGGMADTDVAVHPAFRGRGLAARMLKECSAQAAARLRVSHLRAVVFECNAASRRSFLRGGFHESGRQTLSGRDCAIFDWQASREGAHVG
jgi:RimJ/RimL family protein N-acetyltransferase